MGSSSARTNGLARALAGLVMIAGIVAVVVGVVLPVNQLTQPGGTVDVAVPDPATRGVDLDLSQAAGPVSLTTAGPAHLQVADLPAGLRLLSEVPALALGLLAVVAAWLLRAVLLEVASGRPFATGVSRRLTGLAGIALVAAFAPHALRWAASTAVLAHTGLANQSAALSAPTVVGDLGMLLLAALLLVAAAVFREGARLAHETEGLV